MAKLRLYAAGSNSHGQLGIGSEEDAHLFVECPLQFDVPSEDIPRLRVKLATGANHTLLFIARKKDDDDGTTLEQPEVFAAGSTAAGQLGRRSEDTQVTFTPLDVTELLYTLHGDDWSRLPVSARNLRLRDVAASWETSFLLLEGKRDPSTTCILGMGANDYGQMGGAKVAAGHQGPSLLPVASASGIANILSGPRHTVAVDRKGRLSGWGLGRHGQLDRINVLSRTRPKIAMATGFTGTQEYSCIGLGHQHSCLVSKDKRSVHLAGSNKKGQLGSSGTLDTVASISHPPGVSVSAYTTWTSTFILEEHEGRTKLFSFGSNGHGQLGRVQRDSAKGRQRMGEVVFPLEEPYTIEHVSAGSEHVLAILRMEKDGRKEVWGWGWNEHGNLGKGENFDDIVTPSRIWAGGLFQHEQRSNIDSDGSGHATLLGVHAGNGTSWIILAEEANK